MPNNYASHLRRTYCLGQDEYDARAAAQNYLCKVCREQNPPGRNGEPKPLGVDHNHITGANRGLLCDRCNKVLGFVKDSQELLDLLRFYLREYDGPACPYIPNNSETWAARDAAFERSLLELPADPSGTVPEEYLSVLPAGFASDLSSLADKPAPCELD